VTTVRPPLAAARFNFPMHASRITDSPWLADSSDTTAPIARAAAAARQPSTENLLYAEGFGDPPLILSAATGKTAGSFAAGSIPAFDNTNMYILRSGNLVAVDPSGNPDRWARGGGMLVTPPVADNGAVFAGASNGQVYGFSPTGRKIWTAAAGQGIGSDAYSGLAIGDRMLVVPAGHVIAAFGD